MYKRVWNTNNPPPADWSGKRLGLNRDLNPGPPAPEAGIIPLDHWARLVHYNQIFSSAASDWIAIFAGRTEAHYIEFSQFSSLQTVMLGYIHCFLRSPPTSKKKEGPSIPPTVRGKWHVLNGVLNIDKNFPKLNFSISLVASCEGGRVIHPVSARWRRLSSGIDGAAVASPCTLDSGRRPQSLKTLSDSVFSLRSACH